MKVESISILSALKGKLSKDDNIVFSKRYDNIYAWKMNAFTGPFSSAQQQIHSLFTQAQAKAVADMADPEKRAEWEAVALASKGKYKTARGAAVASYMQELTNQAGKE